MVLQRQAIFFFFMLAMLACATADRASSEAGNETLQYTEKFWSSNIGLQMMQINDNMKKAMSGALKQSPAQSPKKVSVSCLNSVAPSPLSWKMWCPDTHATVTHWVDTVGSTHRKIELQAMPEMTADMAVWFMSPMFPKTLTIDDKVYTKNELWHPLDHTKKQDFKLQPGKKRKDPVSLMTKLDEIYRAPDGCPGRLFKTNLWLKAMNLAENLPRNRYVLGYEVLGFQVFTMMVEFEDTPVGMVATVEVIVGAASKGYDAANQKNGVTAAMAKAANTMLLEAVLAPYRANGDFDASLDAVTRHVVEEFGNLPNFVPQAWNEDERGRLPTELLQFKKNLVTLVRSGNSKAAAQAGL